MPTPYAAALVTVPNRKIARKIAQGLLERRLAACVNIVPGLESHYWWRAKIERAEELLLIAKTRTRLVPGITQFMKKNHPYSVPEVIAWEIAEGNRAYLDWIKNNTSTLS